jgi:antitoxin VapB
VALNIKNATAERLAHELAAETGQNLTTAVITALEHYIALVRRRHQPAGLMGEIEALQAFVRSHPDLDPRPPEEILGYDAFGLPT